MKKFLTIILAGLGFAILTTGLGWADSTASVSCTSPTVNANAGDTGVTAYVNCVISAPDANSSYRITASNDNLMVPASVYLNQGLRFMTATLQPAVISTDNSVNSISGTSSGFTARLSSGSSPKLLRFTYAINLTNATSSGLYTTLLTPPSYRYQICTTPSCSQQAFSGSAMAALSVNLSATPVSVSCSSAPVNATPGGGPFSLAITCTMSGGQPSKLSPSTQNMFSPTTITLTNGTSNLSATLQPAVTSPDGTVGSISGTAGGGFTGNITATPAKIQVQYQGATTNITPAGSYTSAPVAFTWSTL